MPDLEVITVAGNQGHDQGGCLSVLISMDLLLVTSFGVIVENLRAIRSFVFSNLGVPQSGISSSHAAAAAAAAAMMLLLPPPLLL